MLSLGISNPNKAGAEARQRREKSEMEQEGKGFLLATCCAFIYMCENDSNCCCRCQRNK